ncbi:hypothetical protein BSKO_00739 [Bryopsis sp. KO-2023]|nr:hypothetical protein BSKO_00739 [Bryopsis sp. KO-2023]
MADSQRAPAVTAVEVIQHVDKPAHDSQPRLKAIIFVFTFLLSLLGLASVLSFILLPHDISSIIIQSVAVLMGGLSVAAWWELGKPCWRIVRWKCPLCSCLDLAHPPNPLDLIKLCCFAISSTGPVVIMMGSVAILWISKSYVAAATLTIMLALVASFVVYLDLLAVVQCLSATKRRIFVTEGCPEVESLKSCLSCATRLNLGIFAVVFFLSMMFNIGITIIGLVTLGTVEEVWRCGLAFVPTGLLLFVVPFLATAIALNCIVLLGCLGGFVRCSRYVFLDGVRHDDKSLHNEDHMDNMENGENGESVEAVDDAVQITPPAFAMETLR